MEPSSCHPFHLSGKLRGGRDVCADVRPRVHKWSGKGVCGAGKFLLHQNLGGSVLSIPTP